MSEQESTEPKPTVDQRLDAIQASPGKFAFDGCHKIYLLNSEGALAEAEEYGYEIYERDQIKWAWDESCSLRFVSDFDVYGEHPLAIAQFEYENELVAQGYEWDEERGFVKP